MSNELRLFSMNDVQVCTAETMVKIAQSYAQEAFETVLEVMRDPDQPGNTRLKAADTVLDRAYGKAAQQLQLDANVNVSLFEFLSDPKVIEHVTSDRPVPPLPEPRSLPPARSNGVAAGVERSPAADLVSLLG